MRLRFRLGFGVLAILLASRAAYGQWPYEYYDDFTTAKWTADSYDHSAVWWPELISLRGYLRDVDAHGQPLSALLFCGGFEVHGSAQLGYRFPLAGDPGPSQLMGSLWVDVLYRPPGGSLSYSVSGDGTTWTSPLPLAEGREQIALGSDQGSCYVKLVGANAVIDNLQVVLTPEPSTLAMVAMGGLAAGKRRRGRRRAGGLTHRKR